MSLKKVSKEQPDKFKFSDENLNLANKIVLNYPSGKKKNKSFFSMFCFCNFENISDDQPSIDTIFLALIRISSFFLFSVLFIFPICSYFFFKTKSIFMS